MTFGKIVKNRHRMPCLEQFFHTNRADVARATSDKYVHCHQPKSEEFTDTTVKCGVRPYCVQAMEINLSQSAFAIDGRSNCKKYGLTPNRKRAPALGR